MAKRSERGQALILVLVALGLFLIGAIGFALDGSQLYFQRQMAQAAADAAAQAAAMSIFAGTVSYPTGTSFTCTASDTRSPCVYAARNGFSQTSDTVAVSVSGTSPAGVTAPCASSDFPGDCFVQVTATRTVNTTLMQFLGTSASSVKAIAVAAITQNSSPIPIIVAHPTLPASFSINGNPTITITGGPARSIQVNSSDTGSVSIKGAASAVNLSGAGPSGGPGGYFGNFGGPSSYPKGTLTPSTHYVEPSSPVPDPLIHVPEPTKPTNTGTMGTSASVKNGVSGCTASKGCTLYHPGYWTGSTLPQIKNDTALFAPGVYWIEQQGLSTASNGNIQNATGFADDPDTGQGVMFYNGCSVALSSCSYQPFNLSANGNIGVSASSPLLGSKPSGKYKSILFFQARNTPTQLSHSLGGNGNMFISGTIYLHNSSPTSSVYQTLSLQGTPGNSTQITGEIIVDTLSLGGNAGITMNLTPLSLFTVDQVALVR